MMQENGPVKGYLEIMKNLSGYQRNLSLSHLLWDTLL